MSGPETADFFNLDTAPIPPVERPQNFGFEIRNTPEPNPNAAKYVKTTPNILQKGQDQCAGEIAKGCSWSKKDGTNSQSGSIGNVLK